MGSEKAEYNIGMMYRSGKGVPKDDAEALKWFRKAAGRGMLKAMFNVGLSYHAGKGVPQDEFEAMRWFKKAADMGHKKSQNMVDMLQKKFNVITTIS